MHGFVVSVIPNWSDNFDLVPKSTQRKRTLPHARDTLLVPSGRQPFGRISELRMGVEAQIGHRIDLEDQSFLFGNASKIWVLASEKREALLLLLSSPGHTNAVVIPQSLDSGGLSDIHAITPVGLDIDHSTLDAAMLADDCILQITEHAISISRNAGEELLTRPWPDGNKAIAAAIEPRISCATVALWRNGESQLGFLRAKTDGEEVSIESIGPAVRIEAEIVSLVIHPTPRIVFAVAGTSTGALHIFKLSADNGLQTYLEHQISENPDTVQAVNVCENVLVIGDYSDLIVLCGLRGGSIYAFELKISPDGMFWLVSTSR